jgi:hypothetical protein
MALVILVVMLSGIGLTACGGDDNGETTTETATAQGGDETTSATEPGSDSKAEFIEQADAICQSYEPDQRDLELRITAWQETVSAESLNLQEGADLIHESADLVEDEASELNQLRPPPGDEQIFDRYLSLAEEASTILRQTADDLEAGNLADADALIDDGRSVADRAKGIAQGYGFEVCGADH